MEDQWKQELKLADDLQKLCSKKGKEIDKRETAPILYELGLIYRQRSPDKIRLLQCAGLFNAAIVRCPSNPQYVDSLRQLCSHVLELANAKNLESDLIAISREVRERIIKMRSRVKGNLSQIEEIPFHVSNDEELWNLEIEKVKNVRILQTHMSQDYTEIMDFISQHCLQILGPFPCKFALVGMGSLARKEITPCSDFKHIIVLEQGVLEQNNYGEILEYFRWYSVIFIIILINLQETILRFLAIPSLNDPANPSRNWFHDAHTPCGISPDCFAPEACKMTLGGRQPTKYKPWKIDMIKPVNEMVKLLSTEESLKNGYNLSDVLTKTCFVSGDLETYNDFAERVKTTFLHTRVYNSNEVDKQLSEIRKNFNISSLVHRSTIGKLLDVKRFLYRAVTLVVSALGRLYSLHQHSCFEIIESMKNNSAADVIDDETAHYLSYAVAIAGEVKLKVDMFKRGQDDLVNNDLHEFNLGSDAFMKEFVHLAGERNLVDYITIALKLQISTEKKKCFCRNVRGDRSDRFKILNSLKMHDRLFKEWNLYLKANMVTTFKEDWMIKYFVAAAYALNNMQEMAFPIYNWLVQHPIDDSFFNAIATAGVGQYLLHTEQYQNAISYFDEARRTFRGLNKNVGEKYVQLSYILSLCADCKVGLGDYIGGLAMCRDAFHYMSMTDYSTQETRYSILLVAGICLMWINKFDQAIDKLREVLTWKQDTNSLERDDTLYYIYMAECYMGKKKYQRALSCLAGGLTVSTFLVPIERQNEYAHIRLMKEDIKIRIDRLAQISSKDLQSKQALELKIRINMDNHELKR